MVAHQIRYTKGDRSRCLRRRSGKALNTNCRPPHDQENDTLCKMYCIIACVLLMCILQNEDRPSRLASDVSGMRTGGKCTFINDDVSNLVKYWECVANKTSCMRCKPSVCYNAINVCPHKSQPLRCNLNVRPLTVMFRYGEGKNGHHVIRYNDICRPLVYLDVLVDLKQVMFRCNLCEFLHVCINETFYNLFLQAYGTGPGAKMSERTGVSTGAGFRKGCSRTCTILHRDRSSVQFYCHQEYNPVCNQTPYEPRTMAQPVGRFAPGYVSCACVFHVDILNYRTECKTHRIYDQSFACIYPSINYDQGGARRVGMNQVALSYSDARCADEVSYPRVCKTTWLYMYKYDDTNDQLEHHLFTPLKNKPIKANTLPPNRVFCTDRNKEALECNATRHYVYKYYATDDTRVYHLDPLSEYMNSKCAVHMLNPLIDFVIARIGDYCVFLTSDMQMTYAYEGLFQTYPSCDAGMHESDGCGPGREDKEWKGSKRRDTTGIIQSRYAPGVFCFCCTTLPPALRVLPDHSYPLNPLAQMFPNEDYKVPVDVILLKCVTKHDINETSRITILMQAISIVPYYNMRMIISIYICKSSERCLEHLALRCSVVVLSRECGLSINPKRCGMWFRFILRARSTYMRKSEMSLNGTACYTAIADWYRGMVIRVIYMNRYVLRCRFSCITDTYHYKRQPIPVTQICTSVVRRVQLNTTTPNGTTNMHATTPTKSTTLTYLGGMNNLQGVRREYVCRFLVTKHLCGVNNFIKIYDTLRMAEYIYIDNHSFEPICPMFMIKVFIISNAVRASPTTGGMPGIHGFIRCLTYNSNSVHVRVAHRCPISCIVNIEHGSYKAGDTSLSTSFMHAMEVMFRYYVLSGNLEYIILTYMRYTLSTGFNLSCAYRARKEPTSNTIEYERKSLY